MITIKLRTNHIIAAFCAATAVLLGVAVFVNMSRVPVASSDADQSVEMALWNDADVQEETKEEVATDAEPEAGEDQSPEDVEEIDDVTEEPEEIVDEDPVVEAEEEAIEETPTYYIYYYTDQDAIDIAKVLYRECGAVPSTTERACVAWTILNGVDMEGSSIHDIIRAPNRYAWDEYAPVDDELLALAYDVLDRWSREKNGETSVGRVLPPGYIYFEGDGVHNYFRNQFTGDYTIWDYSWGTPYDD